VSQEVAVPIEIITDNIALENLKLPDAFYPRVRVDKERLVPYPTVSHSPKFSIRKDSKIFTIGSCFALNIEKNLLKLGIRPISREVDSELGAERIKYTVRSILQDVQAAFDETRWMDSVYEDGENFSVLNFSPSVSKRQLSKEQAADMVGRYYRNLRRIQEAEVVIITLGLVESWFDRARGVSLNVAPTVKLRTDHPGRFELHVLSYDDVLADLKRLMALVHEVSGANILVTVSPVPLMATFRGQDCLQANMYSKCVQRAAVEAVCMELPYVSYFPSFEMVMLTERKEAWQKRDYRHVSSPMVGRVMRAVLSSYLPVGALAPTKPELSELINARDFEQVKVRVEHYCKDNGIELSAMPSFMSFYYGVACMRSGRPELATDAFAAALSKRPTHRKAARFLERVRTVQRAA
jgi:hypothetical protein